MGFPTFKICDKVVPDNSDTQEYNPASSATTGKKVMVRPSRLNFTRSPDGINTRPSFSQTTFSFLSSPLIGHTKSDIDFSGTVDSGLSVTPTAIRSKIQMMYIYIFQTVCPELVEIINSDTFSITFLMYIIKQSMWYQNLLSTHCFQTYNSN